MPSHQPQRPLDLTYLLDHRDPLIVHDEVLHLLRDIYSNEDLTTVESAWKWTIDLYRGKIKGYAACRTEYHDLQHATDTALALARMIHGAAHFGIKLPVAVARVAIVAALLHDSGFIQDSDDPDGTGAKHTKIHVQRSQMFFRLFAVEHNWGSNARTTVEKLIDCTDMSLSPEQIGFAIPADALTARMLAAADLWAQMADRTYLEKLLLLYFELHEGGLDMFSNEEDLLLKTPQFYTLVDERLKYLSPVVDGFLTIHFRERWGVDDNLYRQGIERQRNYLHEVMKLSTDKPSRLLRRDGIVERVKAHFSSIS